LAPRFARGGDAAAELPHSGGWSREDSAPRAGVTGGQAEEDRALTMYHRRAAV